MSAPNCTHGMSVPLWIFVSPVGFGAGVAGLVMRLLWEGDRKAILVRTFTLCEAKMERESSKEK